LNDVIADLKSKEHGCRKSAVLVIKKDYDLKALGVDIEDRVRAFYEGHKRGACRRELH
jgi:hypothetical protein